MDISKEVVNKLIKENVKTEKGLEQVKKCVAKKYKTSFPTNIRLLEVYHKMSGDDEEILSLLKTRPIRSLSGVVNISILTKPFDCPGKCIYCPSQKGVPKSYLHNEPAVMRALLNKYHPQKQIKMRIASLEKTGHPTEKIEIRIVGGTWSFYPKKYRSWFIKSCFDACNKEKSKSLEEAQRKNETAKHRIVCLSIETRPDFITKKEIKELRNFGITMVELGIQSLSDKVMKFTKRGHGQKESIKATKLLKDAGFKVCYQVMLNLPKSTPTKDIDTFRQIFKNSDYRPDFLKIYPCLAIKGTPLYSLWEKGEYKVFSDKDLIKIITKIKKDIIPRYVRIQRLFRDIPVQSIGAGCKISNLRESIKEEALKNNWRCKCIRCREVRGDYDLEETLLLFKEEYGSSRGKEVFLTLENKKRNKLYALLRLRKTDNAYLSTLKNAGIIREIRTYGQHLPVKKRRKDSPQHRGLGKRLIKEAESIVKKDFERESIAVISGVGVREYWKTLGYRLKDTYMIKDLTNGHSIK